LRARRGSVQGLRVLEEGTFAHSSRLHNIIIPVAELPKCNFHARLTCFMTRKGFPPFFGIGPGFEVAAVELSK